MSVGPPLGQLPYEGIKQAAPLLPAVQAALERVEQHVASAGRDVLLLGPPGVGKTLLLRRLAAQSFRPGRVFYCPFLHFEPQEATRWLLARVGLPANAGEERLVPELMRGGRPWAPNLLLLDEAQAIPEDTLRYLATLLRRADWSLSRVWAGIDGPALYRIPRLIDTDMPRVPLVYRRAESEPRAALDAILHDSSLSPSERRALGILTAPGPETLAEAPRELHRILDGRPPRGMSGRQVVLSRLSAVHQLAARATGAGRARLQALARSLEPAVSAVGRRLRHPGHLVPAWRRAGIAAGAVGFAGLVVGLLSIAPQATEPTGAPAPPAAVAPVLVDINAVPWAHIVVDGREVGATPIGNLALAPGSHQIQARFGYGELAERTVEVSVENRRVAFRGSSVGGSGQK